MAEVQIDKVQEDKDKDDKKFDVKVAYNGITKKIDSALTQLVTALLQAAIQAFAISQNPHLLSLYREDGTLVPEDKTVEGAAIKKNELLLLRPNAVKGGTCS